MYPTSLLQVFLTSHIVLYCVKRSCISVTWLSYLLRHGGTEPKWLRPIPQAFYRDISNKPHSFILYEKKLHEHKRSLSKLFTQAHWSHSQSHTNGFLKLVQALLQIHPCFFSHSIKQQVLLLSAVAVSLHHLPKMSEVSSHMQKMH